LDSRLLRNIERSGYVYPRRIQRAVIPLMLMKEFDSDLKGQAETGTGKTAVSRLFGVRPLVLCTFLLITRFRRS
jgi:hypothetical protein